MGLLTSQVVWVPGMISFTGLKQPKTTSVTQKLESCTGLRTENDILHRIKNTQDSICDSKFDSYMGLETIFAEHSSHNSARGQKKTAKGNLFLTVLPFFLSAVRHGRSSSGPSDHIYQLACPGRP